MIIRNIVRTYSKNCCYGSCFTIHNVTNTDINLVRIAHTSRQSRAVIAFIFLNFFNFWIATGQRRRICHLHLDCHYPELCSVRKSG
nr:MAG TPA_asm: Poxvirus poly(A) polymerase nucleotidyltransferase domain [Caudoviricetes sp.]